MTHRHPPTIHHLRLPPSRGKKNAIEMKIPSLELQNEPKPPCPVTLVASRNPCHSQAWQSPHHLQTPKNPVPKKQASPPPTACQARPHKQRPLPSDLPARTPSANSARPRQSSQSSRVTPPFARGATQLAMCKRTITAHNRNHQKSVENQTPKKQDPARSSP